MSTPFNKISINIKKLRQAYGETQQELADAINVSASAVANYEKGDRQVDVQKLEAIALRYRLPLEELVRTNVSTHMVLDFTPDYNMLVEMLKHMLPLFCSDIALENLNFKKSYEYTLKIWETIEKEETPSEKLIDTCFDCYEKAADESQPKELIANYLSLIFLFALAITADVDNEKLNNALRNSRIIGDAIERKLFLRKGEFDITEKKVKDNLTREFNELILPIIYKLHNSPEWTDLAHYYLSLRYLNALVDNDYSDDFNIAIGIEMMKSLTVLENRYANNYFSFIESIQGSND